MDNFPQLRKLSKRVMLSGYGIIVLVWAIITGFILYDYTISLFEVESTKGGTFVEAITEPLSFLPYRGDPEKNHFFQTLLFRGCISTPGSDNTLSGEQTKDLCQIITLSPNEYEIRINTGFTWSDKVEMTINDVFFTYQSIIKENKRQQNYLQSYQRIELTGKNDESFRIKFPNDSKNHQFFFSLPILPMHIVGGISEAESYTELFSREPVTSTCVKIDTSINDSSSLVFDMSDCKDSNINYYQLKSFDDDRSLTSYLTNNSSKKFLSLIPGQSNISGYTLLPVYDNSFMFVFFNTQSSRLTPRIQRAIAGHINKYFWAKNNEGYLGQYTGIINTFQSDGTDVVSYIQEKNPRLSYDRKGLEQAGVQALPNNITIDGINNKRAFFLEAQTGTSYAFSLTTVQEMSFIQGQSDQSKKPLTIKSDITKKNHRITLTLGPDQQLQEGVNTITIKGRDNKVVDIDIYYLGQTNNDSNAVQSNKLTLIYYKDSLSNYIISQWEKSFDDVGLRTMINIVGYDDIDSYRDALNSKNYDITLSSLRMNSPRDIATILSSDDPTINPSLITNPSLTSLFIQYADSPSKNGENQIRNAMGTQMPFFILGQYQYAYHMRDDIVFNYTGVLSLDTLRQKLIENISLVSHISIRGGKLIERNSIISYIKKQRNSNNNISDTNTSGSNEIIMTGNIFSGSVKENSSETAN